MVIFLFSDRRGPVAVVTACTAFLDGGDNSTEPFRLNRLTDCVKEQTYFKRLSHLPLKREEAF